MRYLHRDISGNDRMLYKAKPHWIIALVAVLCIAFAEPAMAQASSTSRWRDISTTDEMRATRTESWSLTSQNTINLGFPYDGARMLLVVHHPGTDEPRVALFAVRGMFSSDCYSGCDISYRVNDGPVERVYCTRVGDELNACYLVEFQSRRLIEAMRQEGVRLLVETHMYGYGRAVWRFHPANAFPGSAPRAAP